MSKAIRTVKGWAELPTNVKSQRQRKDVLRNWVLGNSLLSDMPEDAIEKALADGFEPVPGMVANGHIFMRKKVA